MTKRKPYEFSKEWCLRSAEIEGDAEIGAGLLAQETWDASEVKEPPCPECGQPYIVKRATQAAVDLLEGNPEGSYGALVAGALLESRDLLRGMVGLVELLLNRDDLTAELRGVLASNHRVVDARAALEPKQPRYLDVGCSQCGLMFGPGDHGFSHCDSHEGLKGFDRVADDGPTASISTDTKGTTK